MTERTKSSTYFFRPECAECGHSTADIELKEKSGQWHMTYSGPGGSNGSGDSISAERAQAIITAFTLPYDPNEIRAADFYDDAGYCLECRKFYCPTHWNVTPTGGGWCPAGHFKSLDPHWSPE